MWVLAHPHSPTGLDLSCQAAMDETVGVGGECLHGELDVPTRWPVPCSRPDTTDRVQFENVCAAAPTFPNGTHILRVDPHSPHRERHRHQHRPREHRESGLAQRRDQARTHGPGAHGLIGDDDQRCRE